MTRMTRHLVYLSVLVAPMALSIVAYGVQWCRAC